MKSNLFLLLKTNIINTFKLKSMSKKKAILTTILFIYVFFSLFFSLNFFLDKLFDTLSEVHLENLFFTMLFVCAAFISFLFSMFMAKSSLFDNKDNDLLLSLPIKKRDILGSRLLMIVLYNFVLSLLVILPGIFTYLMNSTLNGSYIFAIVVLLLFSSIIPSILSSIFGYLVAVLTSKARNKNVIELICYFLFIIVYMVVMTNGNKILSLITTNPKLVNTIIKYAFYPLYLVNKYTSGGSIMYVLYYILFNLACLLLFLFIFDRNYLHIISRLSSRKTKSNYKLTYVKEKNVITALREKEIKKYFSSAIYVFNTIFGMLMVMVASIASIFYPYSKLMKFANIDMDITSSGLVLILLLFSIALTNTTSSCISIERDNFWILKMLPVKVKDIFNSKIFVNRLIIIPFTILGLIIFYLSGYIKLLELLLLVLFSIIYALFICNFGLIANLLFPKLDAINDTVIVKQSAASFVGIFGGLFIFIIFLVLYMFTGLNNYIAILLMTVISLLLFVISSVIINKWGVKRFKLIN